MAQIGGEIVMSGRAIVIPRVARDSGHPLGDSLRKREWANGEGR